MMNSRVIIIIGVATVLLIAGFVYAATPKGPAADFTALAQCLAEKKVTMYGAYWCSHCKNEKAAFGDSFRFVPYVECTADVKKCTDAGINGYPTWIFPDGRKFEGEQGVKRLSELSGCALPE